MGRPIDPNPRLPHQARAFRHRDAKREDGLSPHRKRRFCRSVSAHDGRLLHLSRLSLDPGCKCPRASGRAEPHQENCGALDRSRDGSRNGSKRTGKDVAALVAKDNGEVLMGEIREMLKKFQMDEVNLYESRSSIASRDRIIKTTALALLCVFAVGLLIVSNSYSFVL